VRTISKLTVTKAGKLVTIAVAPAGFLYKMVRSIVGVLVKVGEGKLTAPELARLLAGRKRTVLIEPAPAHGLFLWQVFYRKTERGKPGRVSRDPVRSTD
jgi:tRNA pseudouridine38-40 synthase